MSSILVSYSRTLAENYLYNYNCDIGLAARSERLFIIVLTGLFLIPLIGLFIIVIVAFGTAIYRQIKYLKIIKKFEYK